MQPICSGIQPAATAAPAPPLLPLLLLPLRLPRGEAAGVRHPPPSLVVTTDVVVEEEMWCTVSVGAVRSVEATGWDENE